HPTLRGPHPHHPDGTCGPLEDPIRLDPSGGMDFLYGLARLPSGSYVECGTYALWDDGTSSAPFDDSLQLFMDLGNLAEVDRRVLDYTGQTPGDGLDWRRPIVDW